MRWTCHGEGANNRQIFPCRGGGGRKGVGNNALVIPILSSFWKLFTWGPQQHPPLGQAAMTLRNHARVSMECTERMGELDQVFLISSARSSDHGTEDAISANEGRLAYNLIWWGGRGEWLDQIAVALPRVIPVPRAIGRRNTISARRSNSPRGPPARRFRFRPRL